MTRAKMPSKWLLVGAMSVFLGTAFLSIALNSSLLGYGFHLDYSISHYVGLELWSAVYFTLGNCFVVLFMERFLWRLADVWKMPRIFYWLAVILGVTLLGLSVFPSGYSDVGDEISLVTWMHILNSRVMFIVMMVVSLLVVACRRANRWAHVINMLYVMYGVACVVGTLTEANWFMPYVLIFETTYIMGFMVAMATCDPHRERLSDFYK